MSRYVYLVRHGEQVDAEFGLPDGPLSERGRTQAVHLADRLSGIQFDAMPPIHLRSRGQSRRPV